MLIYFSIQTVKMKLVGNIVRLEWREAFIFVHYDGLELRNSEFQFFWNPRIFYQDQ